MKMRLIAGALAAVLGIAVASEARAQSGSTISDLPIATVPYNGSEVTSIDQTNNGATYTYQTPIAAILQSRGVISPVDYPYLCKGDGVADDTQCFQQALTASAGKGLFLGPYRYKITANPTHPSGAVAVIGLGSGWNSVASAQSETSCLVAGAANLTFLTVNSGDQLSGFCVLAGGWAAMSGNVAGYIFAGDNQLHVTSVANVPGTSTPVCLPSNGVVSSATTGLPAGLAITSQISGTTCGVGVYQLNATVVSGFGSAGSPANLSVAYPNTAGNFAVKFNAPTADANVRDLWIDHPCSGVDLNGQLNHLKNIRVQNFFGTGCLGLTHGRLTTNASSNDNWVEDVLTISDRTNPGDAGFGLYDVGGSLFSHLDTIFAKVGTKILAGGGATAANQIVQFAEFDDSTLADTNVTNGITIDTVGSTNMVKGLTFSTDWASSAVGGDEITLSNTGGGTVTDTTFNGLRIYGVTAGNGVTIGSGVLNTVIGAASQICGYNSGYVGVDLKSGATYLDITGSKIAPTCGGKTSATGQTAIKFEGSNDFATIVGDNFYGNGGQTIFTGSGLNGATHTVVANNMPIDNNSATLPAGAISGGVLDFTNGGAVGNYYPNYFVSANGATITGFANLGWSGRWVRLQATAGVTFTIGGGTNSSGSVASPAITVAPFQSVMCFYGGVYLSCYGH